MFCPFCGQDLGMVQVFCGSCGKNVQFLAEAVDLILCISVCLQNIRVKYNTLFGILVAAPRVGAYKQKMSRVGVD